jgi:hypothetical protein
MHALRLTALVFVAMVMVASPPPADARSPSRVTSITEIAGASPWTGSGCNFPPSALGQQTDEDEVEPYITSDPHDQRRMVAAWIDLSGASIRTAASSDGGRTWDVGYPPGLDSCTGDAASTAEGTYDPWLSIGPDGAVYLASIPLFHFYLPPFEDLHSPLLVSRSVDGGRTWAMPVAVPGADVADNPYIVADPYRAGRVYVAYRNDPFMITAADDTATAVARSDDAGQTWTQPTVVAVPPANPGGRHVHPVLSVLRGGDLVLTYGVIDPTASEWRIVARRSNDEGATWSAEVTVRTNAPQFPEPSTCGIRFDRRTFPSQHALTHGGREVSFVSVDASATLAGSGRIILSSSADGGQTWTNRTIIESADVTTMPTVASDRQGRLGVLWNAVDVAGADCATRSLPTRTQFISSDNGGKTWTGAVEIGEPWDQAGAFVGPDYDFPRWWVGEYQGLAASDKGFVAAVVQARPGLIGETGVFVATVRSGNGPPR